MYKEVAEALRKGAKKCDPVRYVRHDGKGGCCALGAIEISSGAKVRGNREMFYIDGQSAESIFPQLVPEVEAPKPLEGRAQVSQIIADLNNGHQYGFISIRFTPWTFEQIAVWLESLDGEANAS